MRAPAHHVHRDAELLSRWHRIHAFLRLKGMPPLRVFTVLKHQSKVAKWPCCATPSCCRQEHLDPAMQACVHVHRFLFVRAR